MPSTHQELANVFVIPALGDLIRRYLLRAEHPDIDPFDDSHPLGICPQFDSPISVFFSASATFYAPSDPSGTGGMHKEFIRATPRWRNGAPRWDCVFVPQKSARQAGAGLLGMNVARVRMFFSF